MLLSFLLATWSTTCCSALMPLLHAHDMMPPAAFSSATFPPSGIVVEEQVKSSPKDVNSYDNDFAQSWFLLVALNKEEYRNNPTPPAPTMKPSRIAFTQPAAASGADVVPAVAGKEAQPPGFVPTNCASADGFPKATLCPNLQPPSSAKGNLMGSVLKSVWDVLGK